VAPVHSTPANSLTLAFAEGPEALYTSAATRTGARSSHIRREDDRLQLDRDINAALTFGSIPQSGPIPTSPLYQTDPMKFNIAVNRVLGALPGLEIVELDVPILSTQASHLSVLPQFKAELREREFRAAAAAGVTTFASIFHACHRELITYQPQVSFELINFMELIGESMGMHVPHLYKRLRLLGDIDTIIADSADLIAVHRLDLDTVRDVLAQDLFGAG
jgi:hypothetical protein